MDMNENKFGATKGKKMVIRMERYPGCKKKHLPMATVIQFLNSYKKMLEQAQSRQKVFAKWGLPVKVSENMDENGGTLLFGEMEKEIGLLQRILSVNMGNVIIKNRKNSKENETVDLTENHHQTRSSRNKESKMYDPSIIDNNADDGINISDGSDEEQKPKSKKKFLKGFLGKRFSHGKEEANKTKAGDSSRKNNQQILNIDEDEEEQDDTVELRKEKLNGGAEDGTESVAKRMESKSGISKFSSYLKGFKIPVIKRKHKRDTESEVTMFENTVNQEEANAKCDEDDIPTVLTRKRRKKEQDLVSCPMCDEKFAESEINDHAFTCNGSPAKAKTAQRNPLLDRSPDFIPIQMEKRKEPGISSKGVESSDKFSEWENACKRVVVSAEPRKCPDKAFGVDHEALFEGLAEESVRMEANGASELELKREQRKQVNRPEAASHRREPNKVGLLRGTRSKRANTAVNWMSDDSGESENENSLANKYLGQRDTEKSSTRSNLTRPRGGRPRLDEGDSFDESDNCEVCYVCNSKVAKADYEEHVNKCLADESEQRNNVADIRVLQDDLVSSIDSQVEEIRSGRNRLKRRLGDQTSWAKYEKVEQSDSNSQDIEEDCDPDGSPIKSFKPVGETSLFKFENQFKSQMPKKKLKLAGKRGFKNGK